MGDAKKIAILVRDRQSEAFRMAVGLTLADDEINAFVVGDKVELTEDVELNTETLKDMDGKIFTKNPDDPFDQMSLEDMAKALADYDVIVPY